MKIYETFIQPRYRHEIISQRLENGLGWREGGLGALVILDASNVVQGEKSGKVASLQKEHRVKSNIIATNMADRPPLDLPCHALPCTVPVWALVNLTYLFPVVVRAQVEHLDYIIPCWQLNIVHSLLLFQAMIITTHNQQPDELKQNMKSKSTMGQSVSE